jgi:DNA-directed RNA polymerase specialized sigma subunit
MENGKYKSKTIYKTSLESKLNKNEEDSDDNLKNTLIDEKIDIEKLLIKKELIKKVLKIINDLQFNYKYIFIKYFGLYNNKTLNMKEIAKKLDCTQQEISRKLIKMKKQIKKKLLWEGYSNYIN